MLGYETCRDGGWYGEEGPRGDPGSIDSTTKLTIQISPKQSKATSTGSEGLDELDVLGKQLRSFR